jgi:ABC-type branched-subunit amino acid transport system permease subunit
MIDFIVYLLTIIGIYGLMSLSLNLQYGTTGLVNLGQIGFFMIGAYVSAVVVMLGGLPIWSGFLGAIAGGAMFGVLMALPIGDLRQDYWAIATLAAAEIARIVFLNTNLGSPYVGGSYGVAGIPAPARQYFASSSAYGYFYLGLVAACVLLAYLLVRWVSATPYGRVLKAIREGDEVPLALGKDVRRARIWAMAIGGGIAGAAGSLYAHFNGFIGPEYFRPLETFLVWSMVILGGAGNYVGALLGTALIECIYNSTRFLDIAQAHASLVASLRMVLIGVLIILVILYLPRGLVPERRRRYGSAHASRR